MAVSAFTTTGYKKVGINAPRSYSQLRILYPNTHTSSFDSRWFCSVILSLVSLLLKQLLLSLLGTDRNIHPNTTIFFFSKIFLNMRKGCNPEMSKAKTPVIFMCLNMV